MTATTYYMDWRRGPLGPGWFMLLGGIRTITTMGGGATDYIGSREPKKRDCTKREEDIAVALMMMGAIE